MLSEAFFMLSFIFFQLKFSKMITKLKTIFQCQTETMTAEAVCTKKTIIQKTVRLLSLSFLTSNILFFWLANTTIYYLNSYYFFISLNLIIIVFGILLFWLHRFSPSCQKYYALLFAVQDGLCFGLIAFYFYLHYQNFFTGIVLALLGTSLLTRTVYTLYRKNILRVEQKFQFLTMLLVISWFISLIIYIILKYVQVNSYVFFLLTFLFLPFFSMILFLANDINNAECLVTQRFPQKYEWLMAFSFRMTLMSLFVYLILILQLFGFFKTYQI
ncbi:MAG: Bax inhibitor-1/YccA family protein [Vigna little leaf phytoplasma]|nr:Bax inhibitor-1/YccA family protein [Vigna little leaf phytoplasma]